MIPRFEFTANSLSLDFINTVWSRLANEPVDLLDDYNSLLDFGRAAGLLDAKGHERLRETAAMHPDEVAKVYHHAVALREGLLRIMNAVLEDREPDAADARLLQEAARDAYAHGDLEKTGNGYEWTWTPSRELAGVLWPVAASALETLSPERANRIRRCANDDCGWLFLDLSRNRSRRWCAMSACGNRAKANRYRERHAAAE